VLYVNSCSRALILAPSVYFNCKFYWVYLKEEEARVITRLCTIIFIREFNDGEAVKCSFLM
jgi:hypothetical protein